MKRRGLSLILTLALCLNLSPVWVLATDPRSSLPADQIYTLDSDQSFKEPYEISEPMMFNTNKYTLSGPNSSVLRVIAGGELYLMGKVTSQKAVGVEVLSGGFLSITEPGTTIKGTTYALDISSDASAHLSTGTYSGNIAAIRAADFAALLAPGCAYFDADGSPILLKDVATVTKVVIGPCTDHTSKSYRHDAGTTVHTWTCQACTTEDSKTCTFQFKDEDGTCICGNTLTIAVDETALSDLIYDGTVKPRDGTVTVTLTDGSNKVLAEGTDYKAEYEIHKDAGEITVTVTGTQFSGTFTKSYQVVRNTPVLEWDTTTTPVPVAVDYDGDPVTAGELPRVKINITTPEGLCDFLQYSYKKQSDTTYTSGFPTDAGTYDVVVSLPEMQNFHAAVSEPVTLVIRKISPIVTPPAAVKPVPVFNYTAQELVTAGTLHPAAVRDGVVIQFAASANGRYSTAIPTGTDAGHYPVWYQTDETGNYTATPAAPISNVQIQRKEITPTIKLSDSSYVYDGSKKEPVVTVKDGSTVLDESQYTVTWKDDNHPTATDVLTAVGTYTATIKSEDSGNYTFTATAQVKIVPADQNALTITGKRDPVCYGDTFTLGTTGGSGNGAVTWNITAGKASASINPSTGELAVNGMGQVTVRAERTVPNYGTVADDWTFTVEPKPVLADVTVAAKDYDGTTNVAGAAITAKVKAGDLGNNGDTVTISGLTGIYDNANVGTNKTVTLNASNAKVTGTDAAKYTVSYPATTQANITPRQVTVTVTLSGSDLEQEADDTYYCEYDGTDKTPAVTVTTQDDGATLTAGDYSVSYTNNRNVGTATVTVRSAAGGNYTFDDTPVQFTIRSTGAQLISPPQANDLTYTGQPLELVSAGTAAGGHLEYSLEDKVYTKSIPTQVSAGTYTVYYKVVGDSNHEGSATPGRIPVTIKQREVVSPEVTVAGSYTYNGTANEPAITAVTVKDGTATIPNSEYTLAYRNNIDAGTAEVVVINANGGDYIVNGTGTFEIAKGTASVTGAPAGLNLPYNGTQQELVTAGSTSSGTMVYSLSENGTYSPDIPTQKDVGPYTVWYKVQGDRNHNDSGSDSVPAAIIQNTVVKPIVRVTPETATFNGQKQEPAVTVLDDQGFIIDSGEYDVTYSGNLTDVDTYTVTIKNKTNSNYIILDSSATFKILPAGQPPLAITGTREHVYYGDSIQLGTTGNNGTVAWTVDNGSSIATISNGGLLTITGVGSLTVKATSSAPGYTPQTATWPLYAEEKPVTAVVTAAAKTYDGKSNATVTATLQGSDLVGRDQIQITLAGRFEDPNAGTDKKVNIDSSRPDFSGSSGNYGNYRIAYPATATASIFRADITNVTPPTAVPNLEYTGMPQPLITAGSSAEGTLEYSRDNLVYSAGLPTGTDAGNYDVWYRVKGDPNHKDKTGTKLNGQVMIARQHVTNPFISFTPSRPSYDGGVHQPAVTVKDNYGRVIPEENYTVTYDPSTDWIKAGNHLVIVTGKTDGNYDIRPTTTVFTILAVGQNPLSIVNQPGRVQYGDNPFTLSTAGGSGTGSVTWESDNPDVADIDSNGLVTVLKVGGPVTITATKQHDDNYSEVKATWTFSVEKKPVNPTITLTPASNPIRFTGSPHTPSVTVEVDGRSLNLDEYTTSYNDNINVGTASVTVQNADSCNYQFNATATFKIEKSSAAFDLEPEGKKTLPYTGGAQELIIPGRTVDGIGTIEYSLSQDSGYSTTIPTHTEVGRYTVWYRVPDSENFIGITAKSTEAEIGKATPHIDPYPTASGTEGQFLREITLNGGTASNIGGTNVPGSFAWVDGSLSLTAGGLYDVIFTPSDETHYSEVLIQIGVTVNSPSGTGGGTSSGGSAGTNSTPTRTTVRNGTASTVVSASDGSKLVREAAANQSQSIVIKPEVPSDVTKTEVSIPASTVNQIKRETNAALTVSAPIADVTIPHTALDTLGRAGGVVNVATEQVEQSVVLTLSAGGKYVETVPGGLILTVPAEDAGPGTVAVLLHDDGTRETIRKSIAKDGQVSIPLNGSATVAIVDNSKDFTDVSPTNWAADAVAFAGAHELFSGTSETTFSPDQAMSRGMLATVLYSLEGRPDPGPTRKFSDISSDAWYADGIAWAAANGIANGYGNGQFGPNDSITREQFVVMLWKYAGSPKANNQVLAFTDADQASGYALDALCWAVENGILSGYSNGQLIPGGIATRAQAAQMLQNFMENT